ncbi:threonine/serine exporter family protein [Limibacterium fermenti]|uniref:threonine/serine exporter family protein n=1 Tax=Limibacterium fermenti TaxID=3229863 RepID=UPI000E89D58E|nr:hypothetical protein [Porphyromonadaceae bacterium]
MDLLLAVIADFAIAFVVAFCWGILFGAPKNILVVAGLLGGMGHCIRFILLQLGFQLIGSTLAGSVLIGLVGIWTAHRVHNPPVVFTMPACITMIPGMYAYRTMLAGIKLTDWNTVAAEGEGLLNTMMHNLMLTMSLLFTLAIGICIAALLFRKSTVRDISLSNTLKRLGHITKK